MARAARDLTMACLEMIFLSKPANWIAALNKYSKQARLPESTAVIKQS
jgi:hypothetical protein